MRNVSDENAKGEITEAIQFDIRDNPQTRDFLNHLIKTKGKSGLKDFQDAIRKEMDNELRGDRTGMMFPWTRAAMRTLAAGDQLYKEWGMGFISAVLGGVLSAGIQAATSVYNTRLTTDTQKDILKIQMASANAESAARIAEAEALEAQAVAAMQTRLASGGAPLGGTGSGSINWTMILGVGAVGLAAVFVLPKILRK